MKKDYQWAVWLIIAIIAVIASSCDEQKISETSFPKAVREKSTADSLKATQYPYQWDKVVYSISDSGDDTDTIRTEVIFNEEYIDVNGTIFDGGEWVDKHTYKMDKVTIKVTPMTLWLYSDNRSTDIKYRK